MFSKNLVLVAALVLVAVSTANAATLNAVRRTRAQVTNKAEAKASAKALVAALKANNDDAFAKGVKASDFLRETDGVIPSVAAGYRVTPTIMVIPDAEVSGSKPDGSGMGHGVQALSAGVWVLTNIPENPKGGEKVVIIPLNCWNVFKHEIQRILVKVGEKVHVVTVWQRKVVYENTYLPDQVVYQQTQPLVSVYPTSFPMRSAVYMGPAPSRTTGSVYNQGVNVYPLPTSSPGTSLSIYRPSPTPTGSGLRGTTGNGGSGLRGRTGGGNSSGNGGRGYTH